MFKNKSERQNIPVHPHVEQLVANPRRPENVDSKDSKEASIDGNDHDKSPEYHQ